MTPAKKDLWEITCLASLANNSSSSLPPNRFCLGQLDFC
jgi:hypothetical protein